MKTNIDVFRAWSIRLTFSQLDGTLIIAHNQCWSIEFFIYFMCQLSHPNNFAYSGRQWDLLSFSTGESYNGLSLTTPADGNVGHFQDKSTA